MKLHSGDIYQVSSRFSHNLICVKTEHPLNFDSGQYVHVMLEEADNDPLPRVMYVEYGSSSTTPVFFPAPANWHPGCRVSFRGPLGHGFQLPALLRRIIMIGFDDDPSRLMPLIQSCLKLKADIVLSGEFLSNPEICKDIPPQIELANSDQWPDLLKWADMVAMDIPIQKWQQLCDFTSRYDTLINPMNIQILIHTSMPCGGIAECGVCAVSTKRGYKMACADGPVFNLSELKLF